MRIVVHDFGGYPYPIELSRALARRGHDVRHVYCASLQTTPGGAFKRRNDDLDNFEIVPIELKKPLNKFSFRQRWWQENEYGRRATDIVLGFNPDVVLSANTPLDAQRRLQRACRRNSIHFVFWVQDLLGIAAERILRKKIPLVGGVVGSYYLRLEESLLRRSDSVVLLTEDFTPIVQRWGVESHRTHVIENWAPLADLPQAPKNNPWTEEKGLQRSLNFVYAGTLAMKHNPDLLLQLALRLRSHPDARLVVLSQGPGAEWLAQQKRERRLDNLTIMGFEPFARMPEVMGTADVLVAILEADAGVYSVPSKVLAYLCAGKPLLLSIPSENLASRIVAIHEAGRVVAPDDVEGFVAEAERLARDPLLRKRLGANARRYAEETFQIETIADRFENVLNSASYPARQSQTTIVSN